MKPRQEVRVLVAEGNSMDVAQYRILLNLVSGLIPRQLAAESLCIEP